MEQAFICCVKNHDMLPLHLWQFCISRFCWDQSQKSTSLANRFSTNQKVYDPNRSGTDEPMKQLSSKYLPHHPLNLFITIFLSISQAHSTCSNNFIRYSTIVDPLIWTFIKIVDICHANPVYLCSTLVFLTTCDVRFSDLEKQTGGLCVRFREMGRDCFSSKHTVDI